MSATQVRGRQIADLGGDISGQGDTVSVDKIKGTPLSATAPTTGQSLVFNGTEWAPSSSGSAVTGTGVAGQVAYWSASSVITGDGSFTFDPATGLSIALPASSTPGGIAITAGDNNSGGGGPGGAVTITAGASTGLNDGASITIRGGLSSTGSVGGHAFLIGGAGAIGGPGGMVRADGGGSAGGGVFIRGGSAGVSGGGDVNIRGGDNGGRVFVWGGNNGSTGFVQLAAPTVQIEGTTIEVDGTLKVVDGTQGAGKVLTSDASGNGSWQPQSNPYTGTGAFVKTNTTKIVTAAGGLTIPKRFATDGTNLWAVFGNDDDLVYKLNLFGDVLSRYEGSPDPANVTIVINDLIYAFSFIWYCAGSTLFKMDPSTGAIVGFWSTSQTMNRLTFNSTYIFMSGGGLANRFDPAAETFFSVPEVADSASPDIVVSNQSTDLWLMSYASSIIQHVNNYLMYSSLSIFNNSFTAVADGVGGNSISIAITLGATAGSEIVTVVGNAITIQVENNVSNDQQIADAVNASGPASALVKAVYTNSTFHNYGSLSTPQFLGGGVDHAIRTLDISAYGFPRGSIFYSGVFLYVSTSDGHLLKIDPATDTVTTAFAAPVATALESVIYDGVFIYVVESAPSNEIHIFDPVNEYFVDPFAAGNSADDVAWDSANNTWSIDRSSSIIRRLDRKTGSLLGTVDISAYGTPRRPTFNNGSLWVVTSMGYMVRISTADVIVAATQTGAIQAVMSPTNLAGGADAVAASVTIQDILYTAVVPGAAGNSITVQYTAGATAGSEVVTVVSNAISVQIEDGVSTAQQIVTAVSGFPAAAALVNPTTGNPTAPQNVASAASPTNLTGGLDAVAATLSTQSVNYVAVATGAAGNSITIEYTTGGTAGAESVSVVASAISVQIQDVFVAPGTITKADNVASAVNASGPAAALVTATSTSRTATSLIGLSGEAGGPHLYVSETGSTKRLYEMDITSSAYAFDVGEADVSAFGSPDDIGFDSSAIWLLDYTSPIIHRVDNTGSLQGTVNVGAAGTPRRISPYLTSGFLWITMSNGSIVNADPYGTGNIINQFPTGSTDLSGIFGNTTADFFISFAGSTHTLSRFYDDGGNYHRQLNTMITADQADALAFDQVSMYTFVYGDATLRLINKITGATTASYSLAAYGGTPKAMVTINGQIYITVSNGKIIRFQQSSASVFQVFTSSKSALGGISLNASTPFGSALSFGFTSPSNGYMYLVVDFGVGDGFASIGTVVGTQPKGMAATSTDLFVSGDSNVAAEPKRVTISTMKVVSAIYGTDNESKNVFVVGAFAYFDSNNNSAPVFKVDLSTNAAVTAITVGNSQDTGFSMYYDGSSIWVAVANTNGSFVPGPETLSRLNAAGKIFSVAPYYEMYTAGNERPMVRVVDTLFVGANNNINKFSINLG